MSTAKNLIQMRTQLAHISLPVSQKAKTAALRLGAALWDVVPTLPVDISYGGTGQVTLEIELTGGTVGTVEIDAEGYFYVDTGTPDEGLALDILMFLDRETGDGESHEEEGTSQTDGQEEAPGPKEGADQKEGQGQDDPAQEEGSQEEGQEESKDADTQ